MMFLFEKIQAQVLPSVPGVFRFGCDLRHLAAQDDNSIFEPLSVRFFFIGDSLEFDTKMVVTHLLRMKPKLARVFHFVGVKSAEQFHNLLLTIAAQSSPQPTHEVFQTVPHIFTPPLRPSTDPQPSNQPKASVRKY